MLEIENVNLALAFQGKPDGVPRMPKPVSSSEQRAAIKAALQTAEVTVVA